MTQGQVMCYRIANEPILAIAMFVLVVDALIMNVSISDCQLVLAGDPAKTKYLMASGRTAQSGTTSAAQLSPITPVWVRSDPS